MRMVRRVSGHHRKEQDVINKITQANRGHIHVHDGVRAATMPLPWMNC